MINDHDSINKDGRWGGCVCILKWYRLKENEIRLLSQKREYSPKIKSFYTQSESSFHPRSHSFIRYEINWLSSNLHHYYDALIIIIWILLYEYYYYYALIIILIMTSHILCTIKLITTHTIKYYRFVGLLLN
jgi:hypothetical protein